MFRDRPSSVRVRGLVVLLSLASATAVSGCETVAPNGSTGISVDAQGRPVIVFAVCNDHIDGATLYRDRTKADPKGQDSSVSIGDWYANPPSLALRRCVLD